MKLGMFAMAALFGATMLFGQVTAQIPVETTQTVKVDSPTATREITTTTVVGQVTGFKMGKEVTVTTPGQKRKTFDLSKENTTVVGNPTVRVGEIISLTETSEGGRRTVNIQPYARGVRTDTAAETEIMQAETQASAQVPHVITRDVKRSTPLGVTETKTTTAVGKVTEYKRGSSLAITAPHAKATKFDLKGATLAGTQALQMGETVKVTETTQGNARRISIQPLGTSRG